jgi:Cysteine-rich CPXCG
MGSVESLALSDLRIACHEVSAVRDEAMSKQIDEAAAIDERYGLEPVIDVAAEQRGDVLESFVELGCPYCGELVTVRTDVSAGAQCYVEDCQVCCQPMVLSVSGGEEATDIVVVAERL